MEKRSVIKDQHFSSKVSKMQFGDKVLDFNNGPLIMGIVNFTPDSFFDGGKYNTVDKALMRIEKLLNEGADIIDIGGESTRPESKSVSINEELSRVIPIIERTKKEFDPIISIDSTKQKVVEQALLSGASLVNDISGLKFEPEITKHVAKYNAAIILMHSSSRPVDMQSNTNYSSLIEDILDYLRNSIDIAVSSFIPHDKIILDPGIGFGKTAGQNIEIIRNLNKFTKLGYPVLIGTSRKSFIGKILNGLPSEKRLIGSVVTAVASALNGASIIRVHDVEETKQAFKILDVFYNISQRNINA